MADDGDRTAGDDASWSAAAADDALPNGARFMVVVVVVPFLHRPTVVATVRAPALSSPTYHVNQPTTQTTALNTLCFRNKYESNIGQELPLRVYSPGSNTFLRENTPWPIMMPIAIVLCNSTIGYTKIDRKN